MKLAGLIKDDIANGPGFRLSVFCSGCCVHCDGCHNADWWDFDKGESFTDEKIDEIIKELSKPQYDGLSLLGGEPFAEKNIDGMYKLALKVREKFKDTRDIWVWSGYTLDTLEGYSAMYLNGPESTDEQRQYGAWITNLLRICDVLVDGPFILDKKDLSLMFRGSSNQHIIDLKTRQIISDDDLR